MVIITGTYPFTISRTKVTPANNLLPVRRTFVAPILPEPIFLISILPKIFPNIRPNGIEPAIYEKSVTINKFIDC